MAGVERTTGSLAVNYIKDSTDVLINQEGIFL